MSHVVIELADEGGGVTAGVSFVDGFNKFSNAHQTANLILKHLDSIMQREKVEVSEVTDVADKLGIASV